MRSVAPILAAIMAISTTSFAAEFANISTFTTADCSENNRGLTIKIDNIGGAKCFALPNHSTRVEDISTTTGGVAQVQVFSYRSNDCTGASARLDLRTCYDIRDTNSVEVTGIFKDGL